MNFLPTCISSSTFCRSKFFGAKISPAHCKYVYVHTMQHNLGVFLEAMLASKKQNQPSVRCCCCCFAGKWDECWYQIFMQPPYNAAAWLLARTVSAFFILFLQHGVCWLLFVRKTSFEVSDSCFNCRPCWLDNRPVYTYQKHGKHFFISKEPISIQWLPLLSQTARHFSCAVAMIKSINVCWLLRESEKNTLRISLVLNPATKTFV